MNSTNTGKRSLWQQLSAWAFATVLAFCFALSMGVSQALAATVELYDGELVETPRIIDDPLMESGRCLEFDCVHFGWYPQTEVPETEELKNADWYDNVAFIGENAYYRLTKWDTDNLYILKWPDINATRYFRFEPIKWRVVQVDHEAENIISANPESTKGRGELCLIADQVLDSKFYHDEQQAKIGWEHNSLRLWLNSLEYRPNDQYDPYVKPNKGFEFLAFNRREDSADIYSDLRYTEVYPKNSNYSDEIYPYYYDMVTLPTVSEWINSPYSSLDTVYDDNRRAYATDFAKARGANPNNYGFGRGRSAYWTRTANKDEGKAYYVESEGQILAAHVRLSEIGVRPQIRVQYRSKALSYAGSTRADSTIDIETAQVDFEQDGYFVYQGEAVRPVPVVTIDGAVLKWGYRPGDDGDYTLSYINNEKPGTASVTIRGLGNYSGEKTVNFVILSNTFDVSCEPKSFIYNSSSQKPAITVYNDGWVELKKSSDGEFDISHVPVPSEFYDVSFSNDTTNAGYPKVYVTGKRIFAGVKGEATYPINPLNITNVEGISTTYYWDGTEKKPKLTVKAGNFVLTENDYQTTYRNNINIGTATVWVEGKGNFGYKLEQTFEIKPGQISSVVVEPTSFIYDGTEKVPTSVTVYSGEGNNKVVLPESEYDVSISGDNINVGSAKVVVTGKGNLEGARGEANFEIKPIEITDATVAEEAFIYDGTAKEPTLMVYVGETVLSADNYDIAYANNINAGTATATIKGKGSYSGEKTLEFQIAQAEITSAELAETSFAYNGQAQKPELSVFAAELELGPDDYDLIYENNVAPGTASVKISGKGNFTGEKTLEFVITNGNITSVVVEPETFVYDGKPKEPTSIKVYAGEVELSEEDYEITSNSDNVNAGTVVLEVSGKGNYEGAVASGSFTIEAAQITEASLVTDSFVYDGKAKTPKAQVFWGETELAADNYDITYANNISAGTATATIRGKGNFAGEQVLEFQIAAAKITKIVPTKTSIPYNGKAQKPALTVYAGKLKVPASDYSATYSNNVNIGTATVKVVGKGNFTGEVSAKFTVAFKDVAANKWYHDVVHRAKDLKLVSGVGDGTKYNPEANIIRGDIVVILWRMAGKPKANITQNFSDVAKDKHYYNALLWAKDKKVVSGKGNNKFDPNGKITRQEFAVMLGKYVEASTGKQISGSEANYKHLKDADKVDSWAKKYMGWCVANGILSGNTKGELNPQGKATRAQAAKMILGLYDLIKK